MPATTYKDAKQGEDLTVIGRDGAGRLTRSALHLRDAAEAAAAARSFLTAPDVDTVLIDGTPYEGGE